jgi:hypothetical protein
MDRCPDASACAGSRIARQLVGKPHTAAAPLHLISIQENRYNHGKNNAQENNNLSWTRLAFVHTMPSHVRAMTARGTNAGTQKSQSERPQA